jgi:hypothetical protein
MLFIATSKRRSRRAREAGHQDRPACFKACLAVGASGIQSVAQRFQRNLPREYDKTLKSGFARHIRKRGRKAFFFEKKKQKTFIY